jgi:hypothetical protein
MDGCPDLVQSFMDWALAALTSYAIVLASLPQLLEALITLSVRALELQERVGLQKTIQLMVSAWYTTITMEDGKTDSDALIQIRLPLSTRRLQTVPNPRSPRSSSP